MGNKSQEEAAAVVQSRLPLMTGSTIGLGTDENGSLRRLVIVQVRVCFIKMECLRYRSLWHCRKASHTTGLMVWIPSARGITPQQIFPQRSFSDWISHLMRIHRKRRVFRTLPKTSKPISRSKLIASVSVIYGPRQPLKARSNRVFTDSWQ